MDEQSPLNPSLAQVGEARFFETAQAAESSGDSPPIVGMGAQITFFSFLVVALVVPWMLARDAAKSAPDPPVGSPGSDMSASLFSSDRERRLWLWTLAVLVAIYATLSPMQSVAMELRARNLLGLTTSVALAVVALILAIRWAKTRPRPRELGAGLGVAAVYLTTWVRLPVPEARSHLFEYGLIGMLIYHALLERRRNGRRVPLPPLIAITATVLLGWVDEGIQAFLPNRVYDLVDVGLNAVFGTMAILASVFVGWARRWDVLARLSARSESGD